MNCGEWNSLNWLWFLLDISNCMCSLVNWGSRFQQNQFFSQRMMHHPKSVKKPRWKLTPPKSISLGSRNTIWSQAVVPMSTDNGWHMTTVEVCSLLPLADMFIERNEQLSEQGTSRFFPSLLPLHIWSKVTVQFSKSDWLLGKVTRPRGGYYPALEWYRVQQDWQFNPCQERILWLLLTSVADDCFAVDLFLLAFCMYLSVCLTLDSYY